MTNARTKISSAWTALKTLKINKVFPSVMLTKLCAIACFALISVAATSQTAEAQVSCPSFDHPSPASVSTTTKVCSFVGGLAGSGILMANQLESVLPHVQLTAVTNMGPINATINCSGAGCAGRNNSFLFCDAFTGGGPCNYSFSYTDNVGLVSGSFDVANNTSTVSNFTVSGGEFTIPPSVPAAPTNVQFDTFTSNPDSLIISWTPSADDGGSPITYQDLIMYRDATCTTFGVYVSASASATTSSDLGAQFSLLRNFNATDVSFDVAANNAVGQSPRSTCVTRPFDGKDPLVLSISRFNPITSPTDADSLTWKISFDSAVRNVSADDFTVSGTTATITNVAPAVAGTTTTYVITASGGDLADLEGTVTLSFAAGQDIVDFNNNPLTDTASIGSGDNTYVVSNDNIAPRVVSITRLNPVTEKTNADSLTWQVTFDEDVTQVNNGSFLVSGFGFPSVSSVSPSVYNVTASGGDLTNRNGTVELNFNGGQNIIDNNRNALTNTTPTGTNDNSFILRNQEPVIGSLIRETPSAPRTNADSLTWSMEFNEISDGFSLLPENFSISGTTASLSVSRYDIGFKITASGGDLASLNGDVVLSLNPGTYEDEFGNALASTVPAGINQDTYTIDNVAPTLTSIERLNPSTSPTSADTVSWKVTFSERVLRVDGADFFVSGTTASITASQILDDVYEVSLSGGDIANVNGTVALLFSAAQDVKDYGNNTIINTTPTGTNDNTFVMQNDFTAPTVIITDVPAVTDGNNFTATFTFSEDVTGFALDDITVANANVIDFAGGPSVYTATFAPDRNGDVSISVPAAIATDAAGNENEAGNPVTAILDVIAPEITISNVPTLTNAPFTATFTFTEDVSGFTLSDVTVGNGSASNLAGGARVYTALITPSADGDVTLDMAAGVAADGVGNGNLAAVQATTKFDGTAPSVVISMAPKTTNSAFTADIIFSEDVTGFMLGDITLTNATASAFTGSGTTYSATITPDGKGDITVAVKAGVATDEATNENTAAEEVTVTVDQVNPHIASITRQAPQSLQTADDSLVWRVGFDEDVTNVDVNDFLVLGTTATISLTQISTSVYDVTIAGGDLNNLNATVTLSISASQNITDTIGNALEDTSPTGQNENIFNVQNDVTPPNLIITGVPAAVDGPFTATFTFSEEVVGFELEDIIVTNGTASNFDDGSGTSSTKSSGEIKNAKPSSVFTALITPVEEGDLTITVNAQALGDVAGNLNVSVTTIATVIDTTSPNVVIDALPADVRGPFEVTVTFNEAVSGFELADLTLVNATASNFTSVSSSEYQALITPVEQGMITIAIAANVAFDTANNGNRAAVPVSTEFIDEELVRARTLRIINNFVARRADQITLNDPDLARRLLDNGTKGRLNGNAERHNTRLTFNGTASGTDANLAGIIGADAADRVNVWAEANFVSIHGETAENDLALFYAGADYRLSEGTLVGIMGQFDHTEEVDVTQNFAISGNGWMLGPYVVTRLTDKLVFDGRVAMGRSNNDVSPSQTYTDEFKTSRWLLKGQLTGDLEINDWRINPNISVIYFEEDQKAYTDSLGINIPDQTINIGRVTFGPRFSKTFEQSQKMSLTPNFNLRGIWDFEQAEILDLTTGLANGTGKLRARTEVGIAANFTNGTLLSLDGFYDGIGATDFEAYGIKFGIGFPIQ